jgi:hypothetical protein
VNVVIDGLIGIIPILGDVLDALFKANLRNLALLEVSLILLCMARTCGGSKEKGTGTRYNYRAGCSKAAISTTFQ